jgi:ketohexokinase/beta-glucosidase
MQDGAPGHAAKETKALLRQLGIVTILWPAYSPDLNPIETLWKYMKEYLQRKYGDCKFKSYPEQRARVQEAWDEVVTPGLLIELIKSMPRRMQAVINAEGRFTKY